MRIYIITQANMHLVLSRFLLMILISVERVFIGAIGVRLNRVLLFILKSIKVVNFITFFHTYVYVVYVCRLNSRGTITLLHVNFFAAHSGIAWSFRFPSMGTLQNLGTNSRRRKRNGLGSSDSCKDLRQKRHTIHLQPEVIIQKEPYLIVTPPSPEDLVEENSRFV